MQMNLVLLSRHRRRNYPVAGFHDACFTLSAGDCAARDLAEALHYAPEYG